MSLKTCPKDQHVPHAAAAASAMHRAPLAPMPAVREDRPRPHASVVAWAMRRALLALLIAGACGPGDRERAPASPPTSAAKEPATPQAVDPPTSPLATPIPKTPAEFAALAVPLRCDWAVRCAAIGASQRERCLREAPRAAVLLGVERGLRAGRYRFDGEAASDCLRLLADAPCHVDYATLPSGCLSGAVPAGLEPAVAPGGACERSEECVDGHCTGTLGCPGVCVAHQSEVGQPCSNDILCSEHLFCDRDVCRPRGERGASCGGHWQACRPGLVCQGWQSPIHAPPVHRPERLGVCEAPRGLGQPCRTVGLDDDCAAELFCDFGAPDIPTCRARQSAGAACTWLDACADGLRCDDFMLGDNAALNGSGMRSLARPGVCRPVADQGATCDFVCESTRCPLSMYCVEDGVCAPRGDTGAACRQRNDCGPYHVCDPHSRTCQPELDLGEPCTPAPGLGDPCAFGLCDPKTRRCVPDCPRGR